MIIFIISLNTKQSLILLGYVCIILELWVPKCGNILCSLIELLPIMPNQITRNQLATNKMI